jgi:WD40 repeat protein
MNIQNRLMRVLYDRKKNVVFASDVKGRVHKFDSELNLLRSSPVVGKSHPINAICLSDKYIFTKDRTGSIGKWDIEKLTPMDFYDGTMICNRETLEEDEEPSPTPNRGIAHFNGRLYTNNGYGQMVVLDCETFDVLDIRESPSKTFLDNIYTENPNLHAMTDVDGFLYLGDLEKNEFPIKFQVDSELAHGIAYDEKHDRFWTTQDGGFGEDRFVRTGITTINSDGSDFREYKISHEDNEFIQFDQDCKNLFVGGFSGKLFVFDNQGKDFRLKKILGPFKFQLIHASVVSEDQIYILLQTGDLLRINGKGEIINKAVFDNKCVWILEPHPLDDSLIYAGTDDGVSLIKYDSGKFETVNIREIAKHNLGFDIIKDVKVFPNGQYIAISRNGHVYKANQEGVLIWYRQLTGVPRSIALCSEYKKSMISTDDGVWELDTLSGDIIDQFNIGGPVYAVAYAMDGRRVVSSDKGQKVFVYAPDSLKILGEFQFNRRTKRIIKDQSGKIFAIGQDGLSELNLETYTIEKQFNELLVSTKESGIFFEGNVYLGGYGYQIGTYTYESGEMIDLIEDNPDYTKAFAARQPEEGNPILLVGGRGGFINAFKLYEGIPYKVREFYIR